MGNLEPPTASAVPDIEPGQPRFPLTVDQEEAQEGEEPEDETPTN
jgi:hypothetical protein